MELEVKTANKVSKELINSVQPVVPTKGSNAGKQMYLVNGKYWARTKPESNDTHVVLEEVAGTGEYAGRTFTNVQGFSTDVRMTLQDKIGIITKNDAAYSVAIASLLK